jgi:hypothetical protein
MGDLALEALQVRIQALQRQVIMLVTVCCIVVVGLLGAWVFKTTQNLGVIRARAIEIVDENGKCIMAMHARNYYDSLSPIRYHNEETPIFWMSDQKGRTRMVFQLDNNGEPKITLRDELERSTVILRSLSNEKSAGLTIISSSGELLFSKP